MAVRDILRMGHPLLFSRAAMVEDPCASHITALADDLADTLAAVGGIGLAAPQIGVPLRVLLYSVPRGRGGQSVPPSVLINPVLRVVDGEKTYGWEACLSLPGLGGQVPRHAGVRVQALDVRGRSVDLVATGYHARVLQHECDHLDGILYPQRMDDMSMDDTARFGFVEAMRRGNGRAGHVESR